eukprot:tig00000670_g3037.t1
MDDDGPSHTNPEIKLESMSRRSITFMIVGFLIIFLIMVIVGGTGSGLNPVMVTHCISAYDCPAGKTTFDPQTCNGVDMSVPGQTWSGTLTELSVYHQFVYLTAKLFNKNSQSKGLDNINVPIRALVAGRDAADQEWVSVTGAKDPEAYRYRTMSCPVNQPKCSEITIIEMPFIKWAQLNVTWGIVPQPTVSYDWVGDVELCLIVMNQKLSKFELGFKSFFLIVSLAVCITFSVIFCKIPARYRSFEQKWIYYLLIVLVGFNDPFCSAAILTPSFFASFMSVMLQSLFIAALLLFWLISWHRIVKQSGLDHVTNIKLSAKRFYVPKIIVVGLFWIAAVCVYTYVRLEVRADPAYSPSQEMKTFFRVVGIVVLCLIVVWLLVLAALGFKEIRSMSRRFQFLFLLSLFVMLSAVGGFLFGEFGPMPLNTAEFVAFYTLFNLYMYILAFTHLPASTSYDASQERLHSGGPLRSLDPPSVPKMAAPGQGLGEGDAAQGNGGAAAGPSKRHKERGREIASTILAHDGADEYTEV